MKPATNCLELDHANRRLSSYIKTPAPFAQIAFLLIAIIFASPVARASERASISGTVVDSTGAAIPGATIVLHNLASGHRDISVTDGDGSYSVPVAPGRYEIEITSVGFKVFRQGPIEVVDGADVKIAPGLAVDSASTIVEVSAATPLARSVQYAGWRIPRLEQNG
jgi:hypothetical protein